MPDDPPIVIYFPALMPERKSVLLSGEAESKVARGRDGLWAWSTSNVFMREVFQFGLVSYLKELTDLNRNHIPTLNKLGTDPNLWVCSRVRHHYSVRRRARVVRTRNMAEFTVHVRVKL